MPLCAYILPEPWSLLTGNFIRIEHSGELLSLETLYRSLMVPEGTLITINDQKISEDKQSPVFYWNHKKYRRTLLPIELWNDKVQEWFIKLKRQGESISFGIKAEQARSEIEGLKSLIRWQIDNFLELGSLQIENSRAEQQFGSITRRSWKTAAQFWLTDAEADFQLRSSLIVRLARNKNLQNALHQILKKPNKVLKRERSLQNISSATEFDAGCLRWYIQQPGRNLQEKVGPKQRILSITRREEFNLLENRVTKWVSDKILTLSHIYLRDNKNYSSSEKFHLVRNFESKLRPCLNDSLLKEIPLCDHHFKPNFVLMQHAHYRFVWNLYLELRNQQKLEDECWKWQTNLWCETGRQIMGAVMISISSKFDSLSLLGESFIYLRQEQMDGYWQDSPIPPGPFFSQQGVIEYIDLRDGEVDSPLNDWMLSLGCQQLLRQKRVDGSERLMPIWFWHAITVEEKLDEYRSRCLEAIQISLPLLEGNTFAIKGVLISSACDDSEARSVLTASTGALRWLSISKNHTDNMQVLSSLAEEITSFFV